MPVFRTADRTTNTQVAGYRLRRSGVLQQHGQTPVYLGIGAAGAGVGVFTTAWPTRHQAGDLGILVLESSGSDATVTPSGWAHVPGSPVVDIADATGSKLQVLWRFATSDTEADVSVPDPGDHGVARILSFRFVRQDITPGRAYATDTKIVASGIITYPSITTLSPNCLIMCIATRPDDASGTTIFSAFSNANLSGVIEAGEAGTTNGNGGGFVVNLGQRAVMGSIGASTGTSSVSVTNAVMTLALEPSYALPA